MKKISIIVALMSFLLPGTQKLSAQRPLITADAPGYMFVPPPTMDSTTVYETAYYGRANVGPHFIGNAYRPGHAVTVYGVAMAARTVTVERFPYLWVYMLRDRRVDSTTLCYAIDDTATAELYCFIDRQPVSYADFGFVPTMPGQAHDTFTIPCYEFYFRHPVQVQAGQRFYVGISHSAYNVYNHYIIRTSPTGRGHKAILGSGFSHGIQVGPKIRDVWVTALTARGPCVNI